MKKLILLGLCSLFLIILSGIVSADLKYNLTVVWAMNESGGQARDYSPSSLNNISENNATRIGTAQATGVNGFGIGMSGGSGDGIQPSDRTCGLLTGAYNYTLNIWFNSTSVGDVMPLMSLRSCMVQTDLWLHTTTNEISMYTDDLGEFMDECTNVYYLNNWTMVTIAYNRSNIPNGAATQGNYVMYVNGEPCDAANQTTIHGAGAGSSYIGGQFNGEGPSGTIDEVYIWNTTLSDDEIRTDLWNLTYGKFFPFTEATGDVTGGVLVNITYPNASSPTINSHFWVNSTTNITVYNCSINDTRWTLQSFNASNTTWDFQNNTVLSDGAYSVNISCTNLTSNGSATRSFTIDTTSPVITVQSNSFFDTTYGRVINYSQSVSALINLTLTDNTDLFAFEINITNQSGYMVYNFTNTSISGTHLNWSETIDLSNNRVGNYTINITVSDSHTAQRIDDFKIRRGLNTLTYDNEITIRADGAWFADTTKYTDRYSFEFEYPTLLVPSTKTFYVESESPITHISDSTFKAHFVIFGAKKWIDFEGVGSTPTVTKINDYKYKVEFANTDRRVVFNSIGGLNQKTESYDFYIDNAAPTWNWVTPIDNLISSGSINVRLNVTDTYRNTTTFTLFNSTGSLENVSVTNQGSGSWEYNHTFSSLTQTIYYVNATLIDQWNNTNITSILTLSLPSIDNCSLYSNKTLNFTFKDEGNQSNIQANFEATINYSSDSVSYTQYTTEVDGVYNFSLCIFPPTAEFNGSYDVRYSGDEYPQRRYIRDTQTFTNVTQNIDLFMLHTLDSVLIRIRALDQYSEGIEDANVQVKGTISGTEEIIAEDTTDGTGIASFYLDPDVDYSITVSKAGYTSLTKTIRPTTTGDTFDFILEEPSTVVDTNLASGIIHFFQPSNNSVTNATDFTFRFNMTSSIWDVTNCTMSLLNSTNTLNSSNSSFDTGYCNISLIVNTENYDYIESFVSYQLNGSLNLTARYLYNVGEFPSGNFSLKNFIDDVTAFSDAGFNDFSRMLIAFIIIFALTALIAKSASVFEPEPLLLIMWFLVFFFSYVNWLRIDWVFFPERLFGQAIAEPLKQWVIFVLTSLGVGGYLLKKMMN